MIGKILKQIRAKMGFSSARSFYQFLGQKAPLDFNYSYYMRIEADQAIPSSKLLNHLCSVLPSPFGDDLVLTYCAASFPGKQHLFQPASISHSEPESSSSKRDKKVQARNVRIPQKVLSERQIAVLCRSQEHYFLFLTVTLARRPLHESELTKLFSETNLSLAIRDLQEVRVLLREGDQILSTFPEWSFPKAETRSMRTLYAKLDDFDRVKTAFFNLSKTKSSEIFRRVSPRYLALIVQNLELLFQTVRLSEDIDTV